MRRILYIIFAVILLSNAAKAQQPYFFSEFFEAAPAFNPAFTGINDFIDLTLIRRNQWLGTDGAPTTNYIGIYNNLRKEEIISIKELSLRISNPHLYDSMIMAAPRVKDKIKHGYGGNLIYDTQNPYSQFIGNLNYSLHLDLKNNLHVAFGLNVGIHNQKIDLSKINLRDPDQDDFFQKLVAQGGNNTSINIVPGILFYGPSFYIGYSAGNLVNINIEDIALTDDINKLVQYVQAGYQMPMGEYLKLQGSIFYYYYGKDLNSLDTNLKLNINQKGYLGVTYRTTKDAVFMGGLYIQKKFHFGYSYDMKIAGRNDLNNGAHEITLGFMLSNPDLNLPYVW